MKHYEKVDWCWDDSGCLGLLTFDCPYCKFENDTHTDVYNLEEPKILTCEKCGKNFVIKRETYLEDVES